MAPDPAIAEVNWSWDATSDHVRAADSLAELAGTPAGQDWDAWARDALGSLSEDQRLEVETAVRCGEQFELDVAVRRPDNRLRALRITGRGQIDERGRFVGAAGTARDMGDAADLVAAEERYRFLVTAATREAVFDWNLDTGACYWNDRLLDLVGLTREQFDSLEGAHVLFHPDDVPAMNVAKERHYEGQAPLYEVEHRLRHQSGAYLTVLTRGYAQFSDGRPVRMVGLVHDLTAQRELAEAEERLRFALDVTEERLRFALDATGNGMWDYDTTSGQLWWNARLREQLGYPAHAAPDVGWALAHLSDADAQKVRALWASRPGEPFCTEVSWQLGAASRRLRCRGRVEYGPSGEPRRAVGVVADISDVRRLEIEREQVASELADSVVPDLAASSIYTETAQMRDSAADAPQRREALGALSQHLRRARHELQSIIRGLRFHTIGLRTSLKYLLSDERASSRFELTVDDFDDVDVDVDGAAGHAAFVIVREALDNVARHANAAHVSVRLSHDALTAYVVVEDNGDGFLTGDIAEGRGLSAMRERARTHGGDVELDSQPGRGTRVLLTLPVRPGPPIARSTNTPDAKPTGDP